LQALKDILNSFEPISLDEMDNVKLMNRMDVKYTFHRNQLSHILEQLTDSYRVLDINGTRITRYESLYFDTMDFSLYNRHHSGRLNRYKVRFRKYVESNLQFFEIKFKNNKGRTLKNRIRQQEIVESIEGQAMEFLAKHTNLSSSQLHPKLWVNYSRITLVHRSIPERVTIDIDLSFHNHESKKQVPNLVIAEVKQDRTRSSEFVRLMRDHYIRQGSISKYCFGVTSLFRMVKNNNFKPQLHYYRKISNGSITGDQ
jgi:hypothetical protein